MPEKDEEQAEQQEQRRGHPRRQAQRKRNPERRDEPERVPVPHRLVHAGAPSGVGGPSVRPGGFGMLMGGLLHAQPLDA